MRARIGYVSQLGGADDLATGRENLVLQGRLYGGARDRCAPASRSCSSCSTSRASPTGASRPTRVASGGVWTSRSGSSTSRRCCSSTSRRPGLDPQNRANLWDHLRALRERGTTIFLTTHYLEEADVLCDRVMIIDHGVIVAEGTPRELKREVVGDSVVLRVADGAARACARAARGGAVRQRGHGRRRGDQLRCYVEDGGAALPELLRLLDGARSGPARDQPLRADARRRLPAPRPAARCATPAPPEGGAHEARSRHLCCTPAATALQMLRNPVWLFVGFSTPLLYLGALHAAAEEPPGRRGATGTCSTSSCRGSSRCSRSRAASRPGSARSSSCRRRDRALPRHAGEPPRDPARPAPRRA